MTARCGSRIPVIERPSDSDEPRSNESALFVGSQEEHTGELEPWEEEVEDCMEKNVPFLLVNGCEGWPVRRQFLRAQATDGGVTPQKIGDIFDYWIKDRSLRIPVIHCESDGLYGDQRRDEMNFFDFVSRLQEAATCEEEEDVPLYGKDWHMVYDLLRQYGKYRTSVDWPTLYDIPNILRDDWLNFYLDGLGPKIFSSIIRGEEFNMEEVKSILRSLPCLESTNNTSSDYRFCYVGPEGSWTPIHHDVLCSYSWSANVEGFKLWLLFPPEEVPRLIGQAGTAVGSSSKSPDWNTLGDREGYYVKTADYHANIPTSAIHIHDFSGKSSGSSGLQALIESLLPEKSSELVDAQELFEAVGKHADEVTSVKAFALLQSPGEVVFIPSHWYHQVINVSSPLHNRMGPNQEIVVSVNHNWFNGHAILKICGFMEREFDEVQQSLYDCRTDSRPIHEDPEYLTLCEKVMKANCGFRMSEFISLIGMKVMHLLTQWKCLQPSLQDEYNWLPNAKELVDTLVSANVPHVLRCPLEPIPRNRLSISTANILEVAHRLELHPIFNASDIITDIDKVQQQNDLTVFWHNSCTETLRRMHE
eukprot:gb/GECG01002806.1/.p1 GENE.gb/GECG01002806.1/~~gb/GECG01002806.1/.p1  ORF type:complete len:589 (+),score=59.46 gb/GECG01002806.1/:1-1767(+)